MEQDKVVLTLSDDSIVNIPFATAFKLVIEGTEFINDGKAITIPYTVTGKTANTVVGVAGYDPYYFYVEVTEENIKITPLQPESEAVFLIYADSQVGLTSMVSVCVSRESAYVLDPRPEESGCDYVIEGDGGDVEMHVVSNVEIEAKVEEECDWITISSTKSHTYTITAKVAENTGKARVGSIYIYKKGTEKLLQTINIYQAKTSTVKNLSKVASANSYIVTLPGDYKFKAVKGNSAESVGTVATAEVLWETDNTTTAPEAKSIIASVGVDGEFIIFSTPDNLKPGNALIAAKDAAGKVLWSWHIWIPETEIATGTFGGIVKNEMMDRNLGALVATSASGEVNGKSIGMLYQWGRKDPFPGPASVSASDPIATNGTITLASEKMNFTVAETIENPTVYVKTGGDSNKTWMTDEEKSTTFWGVEKTIYDPCPPGYIAPTRDKTEMIWGKSATFTVDETNKLLKVAASAEATECAVFPVAGYLDQGSYSKVGSRMYLWSSYSSSSEKNIAYLFYVNGTSISVEEQRMSRGGYIRCVVDPKAPIEDKTVNLGEKGTANSYIVSEAGDFKFKAVKGNSTTSVGTVASAALVWETYNDATDVTENSVIAKVGVDGDYITFSTPATLKPGNALIAAKDADGAILWSWHIWIPETAITSDAYGDIFGSGVKALDRNLGALVAAAGSSTEAETQKSYGLFYQWGRKDPFMNAQAAADDKNKAKTSKAFEEKSSTPISLATSIAHPTQFAYVAETAVDPDWDGGNWCSEDAEVDAKLWDAGDGKKTMYDPCPPGYKVPVYNAELSFWTADGWTVDLTHFWYKKGTFICPNDGYMDDCGGGLNYPSQRGKLWSANQADAKKGTNLQQKKGAISVASTNKAGGASVRCVTEETLN